MSTLVDPYCAAEDAQASEGGESAYGEPREHILLGIEFKSKTCDILHEIRA